MIFVTIESVYAICY